MTERRVPSHHALAVAVTCAAVAIVCLEIAFCRTQPAAAQPTPACPAGQRWSPVLRQCVVVNPPPTTIPTRPPATPTPTPIVPPTPGPTATPGPATGDIPLTASPALYDAAVGVLTELPDGTLLECGRRVVVPRYGTNGAQIGAYRLVRIPAGTPTAAMMLGSAPEAVAAPGVFSEGEPLTFVAVPLLRDGEPVVVPLLDPSGLTKLSSYQLVRRIK